MLLGSSRSNVTGLPDHGPIADILCPTKTGPYCGGGSGMGSYIFMLNDPSVNEYATQIMPARPLKLKFDSATRLDLRCLLHPHKSGCAQCE